MVLIFFGLLMILPIHGMILEHLGFPLDIGRNLGVFDYTQIADLLNNHGEALGIIFYQAKWIILFYLLVSVLLTSGVVNHFVNRMENFSFSIFIQKALEYFWKYFRLTVYFLLLQLVLLFFCIFLYKLYLGSFSPFEIEDDSLLISGFWLIAPFYFFIAFSLQLISDISKFKIIESNSKYIAQPVFEAIKLFFKKIGWYILFFVIHALLFLFISKVYLLIKTLFEVEDNLGFWFLIVVGQLYIFLKIGLRLIKYSGLNELNISLEQQ